MYAVERLGSYITRGVYTVSGPFHPFGGAVDIIVVEQQDGTFKTSPWYVRFGKFQGVLKTKEKNVSISVNGVESDFHMYLDHKGEAYFLTEEIEVEEGESGLYQSSSGEDTDGKSNKIRSMKSKSCNYDAQIDVKNGNIVARSGSRRARLLGLVFGSKSDNFREEEAGMVRASSLDRAEIAADLLEVKWSTNLATKKPGKAMALPPSTADLVNNEIDQVNPSVQYNMEKGRDCECPLKESISFVEETLESKNLEEQVDDKSVLSTTTRNDEDTLKLSHVENEEVECNSIILQESTENLSEVNSLPGCAILVANESSNNFGNTVLENINESASPFDTKREANHVNTSRELDYDAMEFNEPTMIPKGNNITDKNNEDEIQLGQGINNLPSENVEEEQFLFSDLDELKLTEAQCMESTKIVIPSLTMVGVEQAIESSSGINENSSSLDKCVENLPNDAEDLIEKPRQMSCPIDIFGRYEVVGSEKNLRMAESLPDLWSHVDDMGPHDLVHPCHSLDLDRKSSKWALLRKNPAFIKSVVEEEQKLAEGELSTGVNQISGKLSNDLFNPEVETFEGDISKAIVAPNGSWRIWPFSLKRPTTLNAVQPEPALNDTKSSNAEGGPVSTIDGTGTPKTELKSKTVKKKVRVITPTSEQLASLNLKDGRNIITFSFSTGMLGKQEVDARIYLWKWNTRIVISDVDGTITKSDVLGQFMPWVGVDWSQTGVTHLFSAIKENGYQLLFLSARAISQAYITRQFLLNLKQDGKALPDGPVVISPDGLFPSLYREVIRRAPHEFKIACLEDIKVLFPSDCSPFYAGFGNRDTDEISYLKVGIPKGKIFIINPKGEVAVNRRVDTKSYPSLHDLVHDMFPPMASTEQEDFNSWNFWKLPPLDLDS